VTAEDLQKLDIIDEIIPEPEGGAHHKPDEAIARVKETILQHLDELMRIPPQELVEQRIKKYEKMGAWTK